MVSDDKYSNGTLINEWNIHDAFKLRQAEYMHTGLQSIWLIKHGVHIKNVDQLIDIHKFLFTGIYAWAGQVRDYELSKGGTQFMYSEELSHGFDYIESLLDALPSGYIPSVKYAELLDSLNYLHPFREGNGRTTRLFLQLLGIQHSQTLCYIGSTQNLIDAEVARNLSSLARLMNIHNEPSLKIARKRLTEFYQNELRQQQQMKHHKKGLHL